MSILWHLTVRSIIHTSQPLNQTKTSAHTLTYFIWDLVDPNTFFISVVVLTKLASCASIYVPNYLPTYLPTYPNTYSPTTPTYPRTYLLNLLKPAGHVMHQQFNIQQLHVLPTLYLCVLYLSENKQRLVPRTV